MESPDDEGDDHHSSYFKDYLVLPIPGKEERLIIDKAAVLRIQSKKDHTCKVYHIDKKINEPVEIVCSLGIGCLEKELCTNTTFYRIHNQHIIRFSLVYTFSPKDYKLTLTNDTVIPISREYAQALADIMRRLRENDR